MQYLYLDDASAFFMDNQTYDQIQVNLNLLGNNNHFLNSGMEVDLLFDGEEVLDIRLPAHVILIVKETEPGFKGNTATGATKPATLETGYTLNVPLFVNEGDALKIDTRTGDYIERSKQS
jgi:elongation factor P